MCPHVFARGCTYDGRATNAGGYRAQVPLRVVIADDNLLVREGIEQVLSGQPNVEVVGTYADLPSLLEAVEADPPDVVLTDIRMPPSLSNEGIRVAALLRESHPDVGVVVLSQYAEPVYALALLEAGSDGRGVPAQGARARPGPAPDSARNRRRRRLGRGQQDRGRPRVRQDPRRTFLIGQLTPREREVLGLIAQGKSNSAIADSLVLTKRAVEKHINSIFSKLGLSEAEDASKRVKAALVFLSEDGETAD